MKKIFVNELEHYYNEVIEFQGFLDNVRDLPYVMFLILRDGTGKVQVTIEKNEENNSLVQIVQGLSLESTLKVQGILKESPAVKMGGKEIIPNHIEVTSVSKTELPFDYNKKDNSLRETRLDYRFVDLRRSDNHLLFQAATLLEHSLREFCIQNHFMEIHSPKISGAAAESGAELFSLDYFGTTAYLSQSPQFYKQMAMAAGFDKVFEIGPAFRAENSHTSYHATEINMADIEISWINGYQEIMDFEEAWLKYAISKVYEKYGDSLEKEFKTKMTDLDKPFARITFKEAKQILKEKFHYIGEKEDDLERKEENLLCKYAKDTFGTEFIFVTEYPFAARPFYHMLDENGNTCSYDLLFRGIEITTGAQREHRLDILEKQIILKEITLESLDFYLEFFKYGMPPHGGFAIGIQRLLMLLFNIDNIREATYVYRGPT
ncbi:MAG: aspartate--tRNA(Asn) ligase, partial [Bacilli bacterium]|nr:aspartate--tRNA(Asn) ligase [Bacilli bacterium]